MICGTLPDMIHSCVCTDGEIRPQPAAGVVTAVAPVVAAMFVMAGCAPAPVRLAVDLPQSATNAPAAYDDLAFATVLHENVRDGLVRYQHLARHAAPLHDYLAMVGSVSPERSPELFPSREDGLCFYINTYNAGVLAAVVRAGIPESVHSLALRSLDRRYELMVGGKWQTLAAVRASAMRYSQGDVRVLFALCDAAVGSPPLSGQPFRAKGLDEQLRKVARRAMNNPQIVSVDHVHQRLRVAVWLATRRKDLVAYYKHLSGAGDATILNAVLHFASGARRDWLNTAVGYPEQMIPFDRSLNAAFEPKLPLDSGDAAAPNAPAPRPPDSSSADRRSVPD